MYLTATRKDRKNDKVKNSVLLTCAGQQDREIYETFSFNNPGHEMNFVSVLEKFFEYCYQRKNIIILRKFLHINMAQLFHDFRTELRKLSSECQIKTLHDPLIKDRTDPGTNDNSLRKRLIRGSEVTVPKVMSAGHAATETHEDSHEIFRSNETCIC